MGLAKEQIKHLVGKTIEAVLTSEGNPHGPSCQVFLVFTDNTIYEFYGSDIHSIKGFEVGDVNTIEKYARSCNGKVTVYR